MPKVNLLIELTAHEFAEVVKEYLSKNVEEFKDMPSILRQKPLLISVDTNQDPNGSFIPELSITARDPRILDE